MRAEGLPMTPGAVAAILYARCRACDSTFEIECEPASYEDGSPDCFVVSASWRSENGRTFSASLAIDEADVANFLDRCLESLDRRANRA